jgi:glycosyltransferase involved in cell wall biosynthesis
VTDTLKVLVSAYACEPGRGSEPGAGWAWACAAAERHDVWVLTHESNRAAVTAALAAAPELSRRLHPVFLANGRWARPLRRRGPTRMLYYAIWQATRARRAARALHAAHRFDLSHHVTYAADWLPAGVAALRDVPFVWGPVGGSSTTTGPRTWALIGPRAVATEAARRVVLGAARRSIGRRLARRARIVIGQNADVAAAFAPLAVHVQPNVAVDVAVPRSEPGARARTGAPAAVFAGRLIPWKGIDLALAALATPVAWHWRFEIYGDGPARQRLEHAAARYGLAGRVQFHGNRARADVLDAVRAADVLLFPSLHDAAGWSVAEALELGCPVVCLDSGGPPTLVGPGDGVVVPTTGDVIAELGAALDAAARMRPVPGRWTADRLPGLVDALYRAATRCAEDAVFS